MLLAPTEKKMWSEPELTEHTTKISDIQINEKYEGSEYRIINEIRREKLPSLVQGLNNPNYIDFNPLYSRRPRWDVSMQSRLIESLLMNIPVPPVILFEKNYHSYDVIDGHQRLIAIKDFFENKFVLTGLEFWSEINGRTYEQLPNRMKDTLKNRSLSSIALLTKIKSNPEKALLLKQFVLKQLNTRGLPLTSQEVRSAVYSGKFNKLLFELASDRIFRQAWGISTNNIDNLIDRDLYKNMEDIELILRFFALRHLGEIRGEIQDFLDLYMMKSLHFSDNDIKILKNIFEQTISLASQIYEEKLFKPFDPQSNTWATSANQGYYDAVMIAISQNLENKNALLSVKARVIEETKRLFTEDQSSLFTSNTRTKADIHQRIRLFHEMLASAIAE